MPTPPAQSAPDVLESQLWQMADALRSNMEAAEYKHVVLGLIFLKYVSDAFESRQDVLACLKSARSLSRAAK